MVEEEAKAYSDVVESGTFLLMAVLGSYIVARQVPKI
jgi:hypothetical protein